MRIGINGLGRMGRLALRAAVDREDLDFVAVNEPAAEADTLALLTAFDSVHGRLDRSCRAEGDRLLVGRHDLAVTAHREPGAIPWGDLGVDLVLECSGRFRRRAEVEVHLDRGATRVLVSAPLKDGAPDVVLGVNDDRVDLAGEPVLTAASCTTNCLAPIVAVLHSALGIERGTVTTIHAPTNTQSVVDTVRSDPRRGRASMTNLVPTSTNSAYAVTRILPELEGRLDSIAVRAPVLNSSLVDAVFQVRRPTIVAEVNQAFRDAAASPRLQGILGYEDRPLVSSDFATDPRSGIVDATSTRVVDGVLVKVLAFYDNEWGYANRLVELAARVAGATGVRG